MFGNSTANWFVSALVTCIASGGASAQTGNITVAPEGTFASEVTIAIDPTDPDNLVAAANLDFVYHSTDGGRSWNVSRLTSAFGVWGDPCVLFDDRGASYIGHLSNPPGGVWIDRIVVARSGDGGATWPGESDVGKRGDRPEQDKEWLTCDLTRTARRGTIYMSWTEFDSYGSTAPGDSSRILFSRSTDHGVTWSAPVKVNDIDGDCIDSDTTAEGAVTAVDTNGNVFVVWADRRGLMLDESTDGGATFGADRVLAPIRAGWDFPVAGMNRCNGLPVIATDLSDGPHRGAMYVLSSDVGDAGGVDVMLMRSTDCGATWVRRRVNADSSSRDHFFPAMAIDRSTGHLFIVYYDRRETSDSATQVWVSRSTDGGATFQDTRVDNREFTPSPKGFIGDYIGIAAGNGRAYPIWTRMDGTTKSVLVAILVDSAGTVGVEQVRALPAAMSLAQNFPNPFGHRNVATTIPFTLATPSHATLTVYDMAGRPIKTLLADHLAAGEHHVTLPAKSLPPGTYIYRLKAETQVLEHTMTVTR